MKCRFAAALTVLLCLVPVVASANPILRFDYSGTIWYTGGTVTDGSLLEGFTVGDKVSGSFLFDLGTPMSYTSSGSLFWENGVDGFTFGEIVATGTERGYSYFAADWTDSTLWLNAYQQVGTGSIYDTFEFGLYFQRDGDGWAPILRRFDSGFNLWRVDIASAPLRTTVVRAYFDSVTAKPVPDPASTLLLFGTGLAGLAALARGKR